MADEVGLIVNVRTRAAPGQLDRLRADVNGAVQQGAQKAFEKPAPIKGLLNDFRTKFDPAKGFTEAAPGTVPPTKKADPMSGIFGDGGGGAGGMLGPLAALTIIGQGMFDMVKKAVSILSQASPALGASLNLIQRTLMMTLKPIGDLLAAFLRPIARTMREMHRRAHQAALQKGSPGSREYAEEYYNVLLGEVRDRLFEWLSSDFLGAVQGLSLGDFVNMSGPGMVSKIMGYDIGKAVDDFLGDVGGSLRRAGRDVRNGLARVGTWLANDVSGAILGVGESVWNGLTGIGNWLAVDVGGSLQRVGREIWDGLTGIGTWLSTNVWGAIRGVGENIWNGLAGVGNWLSTNVSGTIRNIGENIWNGLVGVGAWLANDVWGAIRGVGESVWNGLVGVGAWLANDVWGAIRAVGESVWNGLAGVGNWLANDVWGAIRGVGENIWNGLIGVGNWLANDVWRAIRSVGESVWTGLTGVGDWLATNVWGAIRSIGESIWNGLAGIGQWFVDVIRNLFNHVVDSILSGLGLGGGGGSGGNIIDNIAQGIGDLGKTIGEIINPGGGGKWLPWFADGGYVPPTPGGRIIGVAESGEGEWIVPDSQVQGFARSVLGGGGGTVINNYLTLSGTVIGVDDLERRVRRIMDASARESRRR